MTKMPLGPQVRPQRVNLAQTGSVRSDRPNPTPLSLFLARAPVIQNRLRRRRRIPAISGHAPTTELFASLSSTF